MTHRMNRPLPVLLSEKRLLNNRAVALITDRPAGEIEVVDWGADGGYVFEKPKARLTFFNLTAGNRVEETLVQWPQSKRVAELEVAECPAASLLRRTFGEHYGVSEMQILSFASCVEVPSAARIVRVANASPKFVELVQGFQREALGESMTAERVRNLIEGPGRDFFAAEVNGQFVAIAALTRRLDQARCFSFFYVAPSHRSQGFGAALFSHVLTQGLISNPQIFLHVDRSNAPALKLYSRFIPAHVGGYTTVKATAPEQRP